VKALECVRVQLGAADSSGRPSPQAIPGSTIMIPADQIVKAIGQHKPSLASQLKLATEKGFIRVNADFETSMPGVFAGGDCIRARGAASTVMAVQDGKLAARAIHQRLVNHG
jgi:glutamate synthase (NADPH/NADH) small chain